MGNLVQFFVIDASIVTSFISFSTSSRFPSIWRPFLLFQAKAQQDGDSLSEPEDSEGIDDHVADNENGPSLPLISSSFAMTPNTLQLPIRGDHFYDFYKLHASYHTDLFPYQMI
jgi:hypothetical protein